MLIKILKYENYRLTRTKTKLKSFAPPINLVQYKLFERPLIYQKNLLNLILYYYFLTLKKILFTYNYN